MPPNVQRLALMPTDGFEDTKRRLGDAMIAQGDGRVYVVS